MQIFNQRYLLVMKLSKINIGILLIAVSIVPSCKTDFLEVTPQGQLTPLQLQTASGVEAALISTYTMLNGNLAGTYGTYASAPSHWVYGEVAADDAHKGSDP